MHILVLGNNPSTNTFVYDVLTKEGHDVRAIDDTQEILQSMQKREPDLLILDSIMPSINGFAFLRILRSKGYQTPLIFLSAQETLEARLREFRIEAYDYIYKPYDAQEFVTRIQAVTHRIKKNILRSKNILLFLVSRKVIIDGRESSVLSPTETHVLRVLMHYAGQTVSRSRFLEEVWNDTEKNPTNVVDVYIHRLRAKLETDPDNPKHILLVRGQGYTLENKE